MCISILGEPFSSEVNLQTAPNISVTVTAINCVGQTAEEVMTVSRIVRFAVDKA